MSTLKVSIKYKKQADMLTSLNISYVLRKLVEDIKASHEVEVENIDSTSLVISVKADGDISEKDISAILKNHISAEDYDILFDKDTSVEDTPDAILDGLKRLLDPTAGEKNGDDTPTEPTAAEETAAASDAETPTPTESASTPQSKEDDKGGRRSDAIDRKAKVKKEAEEESAAAAKADTLTSILKEIEGLVGMEDFKKKLAELVNVAPRLKSLKNYLSDSNFLFSIDDGYGISTATRILGELLNAIGLTQKSRVVELPPVPYTESPNDFETYTAKYKDFVDSASRSAGIIVLDLSKCYSSLTKAGYREFLANVCMGDSLPMFVFRIPYLEEEVRASVEESLSDRFFIHSVPFVPLSMDELYTYAVQVAEKLTYKLGDGMRDCLSEIFAREKSDGKFYGFRTVEKVVHQLIYEKVRGKNPDGDTITASDVGGVSEFEESMSNRSAMEQLNDLFGLKSVAKQIEEAVAFIEYAKDDEALNPSFHMRFVGNPGTGKTMVARLLGKILKEKGILRTGVFFEYTGDDFIGQYVGHTAPKTAQMCRDAYGGVLFIDEAYSLSPGSDGGKNNSFKQEALNTLLAEMENHRKDMLVIMAGYEDEIDELMQHNPGLSQRVPYTIRFENYTKEALAQIFFFMAGKEFLYGSDLIDAVETYFKTLPNNIYFSPNFSNARYVRNLFERTVSKAVLRAQLEKAKIATLSAADFEKAVEELKSTATASNRFGKGAGGATMFSEERAKIKFKDVCGQDEAKEMLAEIVDFLKNPDKYRNIGARVPKGALLYGPPGTGKTMLAKAVAGEAGVPVLTIAGSDFISQFVGQGAEKVKELFEKARKLAPSIIFIDEIDSIGTSRTQGNNSSALMQLLTEMDGFEEDKTVIVLAATNRPEELDAALRRPGRFDREIPVELPDLGGRVAILSHYLEKTEHDDGINVENIARLTTGFSGAELRNIVNEAAHRALREGRSKISEADLAESVEVVMVGYVKKNKILSEKEKEIVCYHEIGHALVSALQTHTAPVKKITVVPRTGGTLGYVLHTDEEQKNLSTKTEMENRIAVCVGGRAAEEIHFGEVTTGASNDIMQATSTARAMVARYGMADELGMVCFDISSGGYLGGGTRTSCSQKTAELIDAKVIEIVKEQYKKAFTLLKENEALLDKLAAFICERETITGDEFMEIFNKEFKAD